MVLWVELFCNTMVPWMCIRALMDNRLCALDKKPGVRPLRIGCIVRRLISKCVLKAGGADSKSTCGSKQLYAIITLNNNNNKNLNSNDNNNNDMIITTVLI